MSDLPLRADLVGAHAYGAPQLPESVQMNVNENPFGPPPELVEDLAASVTRAAATLNRYPDREFVDLRVALAQYLSGATGVALDPAQIWAGNGSNEVLQHICQTFGGPGRSSLGFEPSYAMHELISTGTGMRWIGVPRGENFVLAADRAAALVTEHQPDIVFLCSPNNPTSDVIGLDVVRAVLDVAPGMVVVDEAYAEFGAAVEGGWPSAVTLLADHPRLIVTRTMSKAFALAGARLGYLAASADVTDALRLVRLPYHLSAVTQAVALAALRHADALLAGVQTVSAERDRLVAGIRALGLTVPHTGANFVLFGPFDDPRATWQALLDAGYLVRDVSSAPGLAGWLRLNPALPAENTGFLAALAAVSGRVAV